MAKNKKKKKNRNKVNEGLKNLLPAELFQRGEELLTAGKQRDAIATLKMAAKKGWPRDQVDRLLFKAYSLRAVQLREKGMDSEAEEVSKHAYALMPSYQDCTENELLSFIKNADIPKTVSAYAEFLGANDASAKIEQHLADRFLVCQQWEFLEALDDRVSLKKDLARAKDALDSMNNGDWETALEKLKPVPRSSPWATARIFCQAMVCFYQEDDTRMQRALHMIPEESVLKPFSRKLAQDIRSVPLLWEGPVHLNHDIVTVMDELRENRLKIVGKYIQKIASTVSSTETDKAIFHLLELFWGMVAKGRMDEYDYFTMAYKLLSKLLAKLLEAKVDCFMMTSTPFTNAANYLSMLEIEFPETKERDIATGFVLLETVKNYERNFLHGPRVSDQEMALKKLLHLTSDDPVELLPELLVYAVRCDPLNREAYEFLSGLMSYNRKSYAWIEEGLSIMKTHFPDDPYPCLSLAKLYYRKNAYRKAEKVLNEAMVRAPHDIHVIDMHVMSLLISADKNMTRGKLHLARADVDKADGLAGSEIRFLVIEKQILLQIAEQGQLSLFQNTPVVESGDVRRTLDEFIRRLSPFECLRALGALFVDINHSTQKTIWNKKMIRVVDQAICKRLKSFNELTQPEINSLLMPLSLELPVLPVIPGNDMAAIFVQRNKKILTQPDDHHILPVFESLIANRQYKPVLGEIKRRQKTTDEKFAGMLRFYEVTVKHLNKDLHNDELAFVKVLEKVPVSEIESIRVAARRLSAYTRENASLGDALKNFDFRYLSLSSFPNDWNDGYEDDFDESFVDINQEMLANLESLVVEAGLTGASKKAVLKFKKLITSGPFSLPLEMMAEILDDETIDQMSREVRIILFGHA